MNAPKHPDFPLLEVSETADRVIKDGGTVYQKWTCDGCGERLTASKPNFFTTSGKCDCGTVTDIAKKGCNYLALLPLTGVDRKTGDAVKDKPETRH